MKTPFSARLGIVTISMFAAVIVVASAWAAQSLPTPTADAGPALTTEEYDAAADNALMQKAAAAKPEGEAKEEDKEAKKEDDDDGFCDRVTELGKKKLEEDRATCAKEAREGGEVSETCKKALKCVPLDYITATEEEKEAENLAQKDEDLGGTAATQKPVSTAKTGATRFGAFADGDENPYLQNAVMKTGGDDAKPQTAGATAQDKALTPVQAKGVATDALTAGQVPATRDKVSNAKFYLSYCREQGYPEQVCAASVTTMDKESAFKASADNPTSSAYGLGQYINATWDAECQKYMKASAAQCNAMRGSPKAQADVLMASVNERYTKYQSGNLACNGLDFNACNYAVYHYAGGPKSKYISAGLSYYNSTVKSTSSVYMAAATSLGTDPAALAQISLANAGAYLPNNYYSSGSAGAGGGMSIGAYANADPMQIYMQQLMLASGYGQQVGMPYTMAAYNPYGALYSGGQPMTTQPGIISGTLPVIIQDGEYTALDNSSPAKCGGQIVTVTNTDTGLMEPACFERVTKPTTTNANEVPMS